MPTFKNDRQLPTTMRTLSEVMETLKERKMDNELVFTESGRMKGMSKIYDPQDLTLIRTFRFEGMSDPADNTALYLFEDKDQNIGYIMDIYGSDSNYGVAFSEFLKNVPVADEEEKREGRH